MANARDIMTESVITTSPESTVEELANQLSNLHITGMPVVSGKLVVGLVSEFDVISRHGKTVGDIMTRGVISVTEETDIEAIAHLLTSQRIRRVPVLRHGELVGIVSRSDLVSFFAHHWWACHQCGNAQRGFERPERCEMCGADSQKFGLEEAPPGT